MTTTMRTRDNGFGATSALLAASLSLTSLSLASVAAGCGPSPTMIDDDEGGGAPTGDGDHTTSGGTEDASAEISTLMADVVAPRICDQLRGTFIGLPGEGGHAGPESGLDPTVGRWWIRECTAHSHDGYLDLAISGTGWTWVDRESMGFRVQQYLRFDSNASFTARMEIGYDRTARIVTIWMRPEEEVVAHVEPRGLIQAHATGVFSGVLGGLLSMTGSSADDRARQTVTDEGSQRLHDRFASGMTVTYAMDTQQMDFMVGALERGQSPVRPYEPETGVVWSVNQRLSVWPGGVDVLGPIDPGVNDPARSDGVPDHAQRSASSIDFELEEGQGLYVDAVCVADFERYYDSVMQGGTAAAPTGTRVIEFTAAHTSHHADVPRLGCPTLLLVSPRTDATMAATGRVRIYPTPAAPATTTTATTTTTTTGSGTTTTTTTTAPTTSRPVRIHLTGLSVVTASTSGSRWDMVGSEPDTYIVVASVPGQREIERTTAVDDQHEVTLDHWLPGAYHGEDFPIRFSIYDDDVGSDELIGVVDVTSRDMATGGELRLDLRSQGDVPQTMGTLRLTIAPVQ
jgi:hypothetical protein